MVFLIYCIACACCALHKTHATSLSDQSEWTDCRGSPVVKSGSFPPADELTIPSSYDCNQKHMGDYRDPPRSGKFFHCDSEPWTDESHRGFPRRGLPWGSVPCSPPFPHGREKKLNRMQKDRRLHFVLDICSVQTA